MSNRDPVSMIHAMRKIKSSTSGFARLYGAKDLVQFAQQIAFMQDFDDDYHRRNIPFSDAMPTYADMSTAQLRCYFSWRSETRQGRWPELPLSYLLLRLFELMNTGECPEEQAAQLAETWLHCRLWQPRLDTRMPQWFKDYCLCYGLDFHALVQQYGLTSFYPPPRSGRLTDNASYDCRGSRFFREQPAQLPLLERAVDALLQNLEPLFALYNLSPQEAFFPQPLRFSYYEPFQGAAVLPPEHPEQREVRLSACEVYRLWNGRWSRAFEDAFRPPSHAAGWLVKRAEAELRACTGYHAPWSDPEAHELRERWLHSEAAHPALFTLLEDPRLPALVRATTRAVYDHRLPEGSLVPAAAELDALLRQEPLFSIRKAQQITHGSEESLFRRQGTLLAKLEDDCPQRRPCSHSNPSYADLSLDELRSYLTWRSALRRGEPCKTDSGYAMLHLHELCCGIGTKDIFAALCSYLRLYGPHDKLLARKLPSLILQHCKGDPLPQLKEMQLEPWFPALFLFGDAQQLEVFHQLSAYKLKRSRFYRETHAPLFRDCFDRVLEGAAAACVKSGHDLRRLMREPNGTLTPYAGAIASFLLKRTEQRMRELAGFPYAIHADPKQMLGSAARGNRRLQAFFSSGTLPEAVDQAVERFAADHPLSHLGAAAPHPRKRTAAPPAEPPPPPPKPVRVDFAQLERIRGEARELTELLIVEEDAPPAPIIAPPPPLAVQGDTLREALRPEQAEIVNVLVSGEGPPPRLDELMLEEINEIALELLGDNLIDMEGGRPVVYEEYAQAWKEGLL